MNGKTLKGYFLTIVCGLVVFAGILFLILQWPAELTSTYSLYGKHITVRTVYLMAVAAIGGPVFIVICWMMARGIRILYTCRRDEKRHEKEIMSIVHKAELDEAPKDEAEHAEAQKDETLDVTLEDRPEEPVSGNDGNVDSAEKLL